MRFRVLGCSGGIGGGRHTTAFLVDHDILIDAGTGVTTLSDDELRSIEHVFITHAHLDHIACLPILLDSTARNRARPLTVYAASSVIGILREHIFNWKIWPDFTQIPTAATPFMRYQEIPLDQPVRLGERKVTAIPAEHVVPAVGYHLDSGQSSLVFTGDTIAHDALWSCLNRIPNLRYLLIENAFSDDEQDIAIASKHFHSGMLIDGLSRLNRLPDIYITHLKPGDEAKILAEIQQRGLNLRPQKLEQDSRFEF